MKSLYDILGIHKDAKISDIKKAFRRISMKTHPDKVKGKTDEFVEINKAYSILSDDRKRKKYDEEGIIEEIDNKESKSWGIICFHLHEIISNVSIDLSRTDILKFIDRKCLENIASRERQIKSTNCLVDRLEKCKNRLHSSNGKNILENSIEDSIKKMKISNLSHKEDIESYELARNLLKKYSYDVEEMVSRLQLDWEVLT